MIPEKYLPYLSINLVELEKELDVAVLNYSKFRTNENKEAVRLIHDKLAKASGVQRYEKEKLNTCQFPLKGCVKIFNNTLENFLQNGNTCPKCSAKYSLLIDSD